MSNVPENSASKSEKSYNAAKEWDHVSSASQEDKPVDRKVTKNYVDENGVVRVSSKKQNLRGRIFQILKGLKEGQQVKLQGYGNAINTTVWLSTLVRDKLGGVHQMTSFIELKDEKTGRETCGVQIVLSTTELDTADVGYQLPEAKGFWSSKRTQRNKQQKAEKTDKKDKPSAEGDAGKKQNAEKKKKLLDSVAAAESEPKDEKKPEPKKQRRSRSSRKPKENIKTEESKKAEPAKVEEAIKQTDDPAKPKSKSKSRSQRKNRDKSKSQARASKEREAEKPAPLPKDDVKDAPAKEQSHGDVPPVKRNENGGRGNNKRRFSNEKRPSVEDKEESKSQSRSTQKETEDRFYDGGHAQRQRNDNQSDRYRQRGGGYNQYRGRGNSSYYNNRGGFYPQSRSDYYAPYQRSNYYGNGGGYWMYGDSLFYEGRNNNYNRNRQGQYQGSREIGTNGRPLESTSHGGSAKRDANDQGEERTYQRRQLPTRTADE